jgi:hypothetical protein
MDAHDRLGDRRIDLALFLLAVELGSSTLRVPVWMPCRPSIIFFMPSDSVS